MTVADARVKVTLPDHPKTKKLIRRCGQAGAWNLIRLFLFAAANRPDGDLTGMDADDIEIAADWQGDAGQFVEALVDVRFLAGEPGAFAINDWADHNPWASSSSERTDKAKFNALIRHHGLAEAAKRMPDYAERMQLAPKKDAASNATSMLGACEQHARSNAPSPSPSPSLKQDQKKEQGARATRLPQDWQPSPDDLAWARANRPELDALAEADKFRDYWTAKNRDAAKLDWPATWRNWIRNSHAPPRRGTPPAAPSKQMQALENILGVNRENNDPARVVLDLNPSGFGADVRQLPSRLPGG